MSTGKGNIGRWARRERRRTFWHLVDSDVAGGVMTRCGRYMRERTIDRGGLEIEDAVPAYSAKCEPCDVSAKKESAKVGDYT